ncbi:sensor histidine kinase [Streptomyces sp. NPDC055078]
MKPTLPSPRRSSRRQRDTAAPPVRDVRGWRSRLRNRYLAGVLTGAAVPSALWAAHAAAELPWQWTVPGAAAAGTGALVLCWPWADADTARLAAHLAGERAEIDRERAQRQEHTAWVRAWVDYYASVLAAGRREIAASLEESGQAGGSGIAEPLGGADLCDVFTAFDQALAAALDAALKAVVRARKDGQARREAQVVASVAPRLHSTTIRLLEVLEQLENTIEDPQLLRTTFRAELFATLVRRYSESLMVLGGKPFGPSREPVPLPTVLRQATAETEHYRRARTSWPPQELWLVGYAGPAVTHLLAALIDNALRYSPRETEVRVSASWLHGDLLVEVEDQGLPMSQQRLAAANTLLAEPSEEAVHARLREGRIGLPVVARLAGAYGIGVSLRANPEGGHTASVVLPQRLVVVPEQLPPAARQTPPAPAPRSAASPVPGCGSAPQAGGAARPVLPRRGAVLQATPASGPVTATETGAGTGGRPVLPRRDRNTPPSAVITPDGDTGPAGAPGAGPAAAFFAGVRTVHSHPAGPAPEQPPV